MMAVVDTLLLRHIIDHIQSYSGIVPLFRISTTKV